MKSHDVYRSPGYRAHASIWPAMWTASNPVHLIIDIELIRTSTEVRKKEDSSSVRGVVIFLVIGQSAKVIAL